MGGRMECVICRKGPAEGVSLTRINAKGQPGVFACVKHRGHTDAPPMDPVVADIVRIVGGQQS